MKKKKMYVIVIVAVVIVLLFVVLAIFLNKAKKNKKSDKSTTDTEDVYTYDGGSIDEKYKNYNEASIWAEDPMSDDDYLFDFEIKDGKLTATEADEPISVSGINGKIKRLTYVTNKTANILVITEKNDIYQANYSLVIGRGQSLKFKKVDIDEKVEAITGDVCMLNDQSVPTTLVVLPKEKYLAVDDEGKVKNVKYEDGVCKYS